MKPKYNPFLNRLVLAGVSLALGTSAQADIFDTNSTAAGFGVTDGSTYNWLDAAGFWSDPGSDAGTTATVTWQGTSVSNQGAFFIGSGTAGQNYTVRLGATGATDVVVQNIALNINAAASGALAGAAGNVTIGNVGDVGNLTLSNNNSVGVQSGGILTINNGLNLNARTMNFRGGNMVINGVVSGTGASNIAFGGGALGFTAGPGTLTLTGDNSFAGNTTVANAFSLNLQHANALGAAGGTNTVASGGNLVISSGASIVSGESVTINGVGGTDFLGALRAGSGGGTWGGQVTLGDTNVRIGALAAQTLTITGSIVDGVGTGFNVSAQSGTGIVTLNPTTSNTYTGTTGIIRGILRLGKTDALPTNTTLDVDSAGGITDAATFDMAGFSQSIAVLQDSATTNINGIITNSVVSTISTLTVNQASNTTYDGIIQNGSGSVVLTKSGAGNLMLNGANTFTGGTNIQNGKIIIGGGNDRLAAGGAVNLGSVSNTGVLVLGDGTNARNQTLAGLTTSGLGGAVVGNAAANGTLTLNIASGTNTFGGTLGGGGTNENNLALTKNGAGTLSLSTANSYNGVTTVNAGVMEISNSDALGATGLTSRTNLDGNLSTGRVELTGGITTGETFQIGMRQGVAQNAPALSNLSGSNTVTGNINGITGGLRVNIESQAGLLTLSGSLSQTSGTGNRTWQFMGAGDGLVSGTISNGTATPLAVLKSGAGTWTFSNTNSYSGTTNITDGTLAIGTGGSIANTSQIIVGANTTLDVSAVSFTLGASTAQTLSGAGTINGNMTIGTNGTLAIGSSPGTMTFNNNLGLNADSISNFEINGFTLGNYDLALAAAAGSQTVSFDGGTLNLLFASGFSTEGTVKIFDFDTYSGSGFTSVVSTGLASGFTASFDSSNGFVTVIPEPSAALLGGLGVLLLLLRRRA